MADRLIDLGQGLELWRVHLDELREQDINARSMSKETFERLTATIKRDGRLEALPFVAAHGDPEDPRIEIVSGHHRTRAARAAELSEIFVVVDVTDLATSAVKAKQLAHNAIQGKDDPQLVAKIFEQIEDVDFQLEAHVDPKALGLDVEKMKIEDVQLGVEMKSVLILFLPSILEEVEKAIETIREHAGATDADEIWIEDIAWWDEFKRTATDIVSQYEVRAIANAVGQMARLARKQLGDEPEDDSEVVALRDVFGTAVIPKDSAEVIRLCLERMEKAGDVTSRAKWRMIELLAADYLGNG